MRSPGLNRISMTASNTERSRAFYGYLLSFEITVIVKDPDNTGFHDFYE